MMPAYAVVAWALLGPPGLALVGTSLMLLAATRLHEAERQRLVTHIHAVMPAAPRQTHQEPRLVEQAA